MTATATQAEAAPTIGKREDQVEEIRRRAEQWRLLDCSVETLERMHAAVDAEMRELEVDLDEADELFRQYVEVGNPGATEQTREKINRMSAEWERLSGRIKKIDNVLRERELRNRLIDVLGSKQRLYFLDATVFVLILIVVTLTIVELLVPMPPDVLQVFIVVDTVICILLLGDFFLRMFLSTDRKWYFRNYWIDFISSIPFLLVLRVGRLVRIVRFVRLLRLLRLTRAIRLLLFIFRGLDKLTKTFELNLLKRSVLIALALLIFGALAIMAIEGPTAPSVDAFDESLWWSFATVVTGGFADLYNPATNSGRLVTVAMILLGLTVTGIFTASLTSVLVEDESSKLEENQHRFDEEVQSMQHKLNLLTGETNEAMVALEEVAQAVSNTPSRTALGELLVHSLTERFECMQASLHVLNDDGDELLRLAHAGTDSVAPAERLAMGDSLAGTVAAGLIGRDLAQVDLEPETEICIDVRGIRMLCPLVAGLEFLGLLHLVLPGQLANDYLYTRIPMTLAHQAALAIHSSDIEAGAEAGLTGG